MVHRVFCRNAAREFVSTHFTEREVTAFDACAVPAMQADYFRYCAMLKLGGICSDADMRCEKALQPLMEKASAGLLIRKPNGKVINGFFAFRAPEHPLIRLALETATLNIERRTTNDVWLTTGPGIFTLMTRLHETGSIEVLRSTYKSIDNYYKLHVQNLCDVIEGHDTLTAIFKDITILPFDVLSSYLRRARALPYKSQPGHWTEWQRTASIYSPLT